MSRTPSQHRKLPRKLHPVQVALFVVAILSLSSLSLSEKSTSFTDLKQNFQNPPDDAKPMMRWWWFGPAVTHPELRKELEIMHAAGIGGVEIQPVYPLMLDDNTKGIRNLPYLSPAFLDAVTFANTTARSLNMRVDITLGSGWPYGGPKTTLDLSAGRLRTLILPSSFSSAHLPQLAAGESLIAIFEAPGTPSSYNPAAAVQIPIPAAGQLISTSGSTDHVLLFFIASHTKQTVKRPAAGAEGYVLDHFSTASVDEHLNDVATPLLAAFGSHPPYSVFSDSLEVYNSDWTKDLPAQFLKRRGYDLLPHLPELVAGGTPQAEAIRHDWGQTLSDLIRDNYLTTIQKFAINHNTMFRSQTYGEPAVTLADEAVPGLPEGEGPQWRAFSFTRWASSASHLYGRPVTSAETWTWLHSPAFRATPLDMKVEADRMFLLGVNQIVGHGWPYSPPAAGEPGWSLYAAAVFNNHNPWFPLMPYITQYLQRISYLLRQGSPANDIAILLPEDDAQAAFTPGHVSVTDEMKKRITPELMASILDAGYNVDYIDAATIDKLGIHYPILVLPPTQRIPLKTLQKIVAYAEHGGHVIAVGDLPSLSPGFLNQSESQTISNLADHLFKIPEHQGIHIDSLTEINHALHTALPADLQSQTSPDGLGFIHRKLAHSDIYFLANTSNTPISSTIIFRAVHSSAQEWAVDSGAVKDIPAGPIRLQLAPYESRVYVLSDTPPGPVHIRTPSHGTPLIHLDHNWSISFKEEAPQPLPSLVSWTALPSAQFFSGEAVYTNDFNLPKAPTQQRILLNFGEGTPTTDLRRPNAPGIHALLDPPVREAALIYINGALAGPLWHPPYRLDVTRLVKPGPNKIEIRVFNTAINELAAQPPRDYTALNAKYGKRFDPQDMDNLKPQPSGLLAPVNVETEQVIR